MQKKIKTGDKKAEKQSGYAKKTQFNETVQHLHTSKILSLDQTYTLVLGELIANFSTTTCLPLELAKNFVSSSRMFPAISVSINGMIFDAF